MRRPALAVDLDGTLLHPESKPGALAVQGFTGVRYFSRAAADLLTDLSRLLPVLIVTGRNARSVQKMTDQLPHLILGGFVLENGMISRTALPSGRPENDPWAGAAARLPGWRRLTDYENCLAMVAPPDAPDPLGTLEKVLHACGDGCRLHREGPKVFAYPRKPGKLAGVLELGFDPFIALGDEWNDADLLEACKYPGTLISASETVREIVGRKNGYCAPAASHAGTEDLLRWACWTARQRLQSN